MRWREVGMARDDGKMGNRRSMDWRLAVSCFDVKDGEKLTGV